MPRSRRARAVSLILASIFLLAVTAPTVPAQQFEWPSHPQNLKVLPKKTTPEQLQATMIGFTRALGVRCPYCHVGEEGKPLTTFDFPSDAKLSKQIARGMVRMVADIRKDLNKIALNRGIRRVEVQCVTCHHGKPRPTTLADEMTVVYERAGLDSAVVLYRSLRERFYGRDAYDFSEGGLAQFGASLAEKGHPDDAIRVHQLNVEQYPQSLRAQEGLARAYEAAGRKEDAIAVYRKMLEIDPQNRNARARIDELQGTPAK